MMRQSKSSSPSSFFDAAHANSSSLKNGCKYPFKQKEDGEWIDLSGVLQQLPEGFRVDEDSCLAYILGRLLARRYFGFPCAEDGNVQVRDFVLKELLADNYSRACTIVKVQLTVLHDYFFTNYCSDLTSGFVSTKQAIVNLFFRLAAAAAGFLISVPISGSFMKDEWRDRAKVCAFNLAATLIYMIIRLPQTPFLPRYWHPIQNLIPKTTATTAPRNESTRLYYWRDKLSQYSGH
ncbi:hypothetical protein BS78_05G076000 [Paspalum vaginatum]|nr:hypothetical protein BS78_05G076000 [Paspalum vaginatum]